ncbi:MAG: nucleotide exchange factor GrpE [Deltaproteobacteria bacterium]|nr:nucleotide exchange factor GrpE [Deltaproteobacteria bacterium]MCW5808407.1 nucleotide exchange factor GrpE [Deltaproteobacteria bacterium]
MSGDANQDVPETTAPPADGGAVGEVGEVPSEVIPVEVEAPEPAPETNGAEAKLAALEKEKKENWDRYLRAAADLENLRKRQRREVEDARYETKGKVLKEMLPVVDNLERAIEHATQQSGTNPIVEGVQLVLRQFLTAFERLDVVPIEAASQPFDPNLHEAISQQDSDQPPGTVVQVLQRGYRSGDRLLRPALVVVAKAPAPKAES